MTPLPPRSGHDPDRFKRAASLVRAARPAFGAWYETVSPYFFVLRTFFFFFFNRFSCPAIKA